MTRNSSLTQLSLVAVIGFAAIHDENVTADEPRPFLQIINGSDQPSLKRCWR